MSATYRRTCKLPHGYSVEFIFQVSNRFEAKWSPDLPPASIGRKILPHYIKERNAFLASTGVKMLVVDI